MKTHWVIQASEIEEADTVTLVVILPIAHINPVAGGGAKIVRTQYLCFDVLFMFQPCSRIRSRHRRWTRSLYGVIRS